MKLLVASGTYTHRTQIHEGHTKVISINPPGLKIKGINCLRQEILIGEYNLELLFAVLKRRIDW